MHISYGLWEISKVWVVGETVCCLQSSLSGLLSECWLHSTLTPAPVGKLRLFISEFFLSYREVHNFIIQCPAFIRHICIVQQDVQYSCSELIDMLCPSKMRRFEEGVCCFSRSYTTICDCCGPTTAIKPIAQKTCPLSTPRACLLEKQHICLPHVLQGSSTGASWQGSTAVGPPLWPALVQDGDVLPQLWLHSWHGISLPLNVQHAEKWQQKLWCRRIEMF